MRQSRRRLGCILVIGALVLCACIGTIGKASNPDTTPTPTAVAVISQASPTIQPTATPTQKPTSTAKPQPTKPAILSITFTLVDAGDVAVHTLPGAALTIKVLYCSGHYATSQNLQGTVQADIAGDYIWNWNVSTSCHGTATAFVTASLNGKTISGQANFTT